MLAPLSVTNGQLVTTGLVDGAKTRTVPHHPCLWIGLSSVLRPCQHSIGYMGDGFYRSKDPTNGIEVLKQMLQRTNQSTKTTKYTNAQTIMYRKMIYTK